MRLEWALVFCLATVAAADSLFDEIDGGANRPQVTFGGSFKSFASYQRLRQEGLYPRNATALGEGRLRLGGTLSWQGFSAEVAHETSFFVQDPNEPFFPLPGEPRPGLRADWRVIDTANAKLFHRFDRLNASLTVGSVQVTAGRQVFPGGVGAFFSAVSQMPRYPFVTLDPEYRLGRDGVLAAWNGPWRIEVAGMALGEREQENDFQARVKGNLFGYDVAVVGGRSDDKPFLGAEAAGNLGDALLRAETAAYQWGSRVVWQGLAGLERVFNAAWSARVEAFYNGFGEEGPYALVALPHRFAPYRGRWYGAVGAGWEIAPRWKANVFVVANVSDPSAVTHANLTFSAAANVDLMLGGYVSVASGGEGEFGGRLALGNDFASAALGAPDLAYAEMRVAF